MSLIRNSLYLCVGVLIALIGLQGAQSIWQISRMAEMNGEIAASASAATQSRLLWDEFRNADESFKRSTAFTDARSGDELRKEFTAHVDRVRAVIRDIDALAAGGTAVAFDEVKKDLDRWNALALRHLSSQGETELPAYDVLDSARESLELRIGKVSAASVAQAQALTAQSREQAHTAMVWTVAELLLGLVAGSWLAWHAVSGLRRQLGGNPAVVVAMANTMASGNLSVQLDTRGAETGLLLGALHEMKTRLASIVGGVRANAESVATASAQIAQGNQDLSSRTEEQASALEETAAAMEQLGSTVRQNADNARQANQLAMGASTVARKGGDVVGQVVDTMKGINEASKKISDIISVIDGIAFQTNILALNAAVEAARAGEQGRGFAVVAGEVRSLARRSAEAAKEIKLLINASVERVEQGTQLVDQAGATMNEIVGAIERVTSIVGEISIASAEQSAGVSQVGGAITQMDQATQQNAELVQESAAAAESLKQQVLQLVEAVDVFKLANGAEQAAGAEQAVPVAQVERRGPNRAKNVLRPGFTAAKGLALGSPSSLKTGTDDWDPA
ncbi:MAG: hypothetical protein AD742_07335 [Methylibium sp. NZG]|nr:MAG: hypothetical protein AD742_07335 [Methylibium sp. NZG]